MLTVTRAMTVAGFVALVALIPFTPLEPQLEVRQCQADTRGRRTKPLARHRNLHNPH